MPAIPLPVFASLNTAYANDRDGTYSFAQLVLGLGMPGDVFLGISTSGNADNVRYAAQVAKAKGMHIIGLSGKTGSKLKEFCDTCILAPEEDTFKIQELHLPIYHTICLTLEDRLF